MELSKEKLLISFSGGRTSAFMTQWLLNNMAHKYEMLVVFANTGREREETLQFVDRCDKHFGLNATWIEANVNQGKGEGTTFSLTDYASASRNGEPFEAVISKYGIPNKAFPHCSRELKARPIKAFAKSIGWGDCYMAIGIRVDEIDRQSESAKEERLIYPLISMIPTRKSDVNEFWIKQPFDLELKSYEGNCDLCWKKALRKLLTITKENPTVLDWWAEMEKKYEAFTPESRKKVKPPYRFFRNNMTVAQIREMSLQDIRLARDESKDVDIQYDLFTTDEFGLLQLKDFEMDTTNGCEESCEAFGNSEAA